MEDSNSIHPNEVILGRSLYYGGFCCGSSSRLYAVLFNMNSIATQFLQSTKMY